MTIACSPPFVDTNAFSQTSLRYVSREIRAYDRYAEEDSEHESRQRFQFE